MVVEINALPVGCLRICWMQHLLILFQATFGSWKETASALLAVIACAAAFYWR